MRTYMISLLFFYLLAFYPQPALAQGHNNTAVINDLNLFEANKMQYTMLYIDGEEVATPAALLVINDRSYIPLRLITSKFNAIVNYNPNNKQIAIQTAKYDIELTANSRQVIINGHEQKTDTTPFIQNGKTYVPLRFLSEVLDYHIIYIKPVNAIILFTEPRTELETKQQLEIMNNFKQYLELDIYALPKDITQLRGIYADLVHPECLDKFTNNLYQAITTPTSWGTHELVDCKIAASAGNTAILYYSARIEDNAEQGLLHGLWVYKSLNNKWLLIW